MRLLEPVEAAFAIVACCGCWGDPFRAANDAPADSGSDALLGQQRETGVAGDERSVPSNEGGSGVLDGGWAILEASADIAQSVRDAIVETPCTPLGFPLPEPSNCVQDFGPPIVAPGSLWLAQTEATPVACWSFTLAGSARCEDCAEHYTCACLAPLLAEAGAPWTTGPSGTGCVDAKRGPFFSQ